MTGRERVAALPDATPVEELPLSRHTSNALRAGGVLTLGELRGMPDRALLALRQFGRGALAEVQALVPAPAGGEAVLRELGRAEDAAARAGWELAELEEEGATADELAAALARLAAAERRLERARARVRELLREAR